jgi:lysophospholipase L1-like esterase
METQPRAPRAVSTRRKAAAKPGGLPPRLRVLVKGNSTGLHVIPQRTSRAFGKYPERLERLLRTAGIDAEVANESTGWDRVHEVLPRWFNRLANYAPDVVVFNYGGAEAQPNVFPVFFLRWLNTRRSMPPLGAVNQLLYRGVDHRVRRWISHGMRRVYPKIGQRTWRLKPARFEEEFTRLIFLTRRTTAGLVLVVTLTPTTDEIERFMPGLTERYARINASIRKVVTDLHDPLVELIDVGEAIEGLDLPSTVFDGLHLSAEGHDRLAARLEASIKRWLESGAMDEPAPGSTDELG